MMTSKRDLSTDHSFENALRELGEKLEDNPDGWFSCPNGWLTKPKYDRREQDTSFIKESANDSSKKPWFGSSYSKRFFVLEMKEQRLKFYKDFRMTIDKGFIDMTSVSAVIPSKVFDAPPFSIDLVTPEKHYTITAESHQEMIRWAFALNLSRQTKKRSSVVSERPSTVDSRFHRFDVTFPVKGPLHLNVMGSMNRSSKNGSLVKHWMVVIGFERTESGGPGVAEQTGKVMKKDFIEAVNGTDISNLTFDEAMELIAKSDWPLTLRFLRDKRSSSMPSEIEGWYAILYPSLNRRRRRYVDLRGSELSFRKPAPGGAAMFHREAFFYMSSAASIQLLYDLNLPEELQYVVRIKCRPDARVNHLDDAGEAMGGSRVHELDIYFKKASIQDMWGSKLSESVVPNIPIEPLQTVSLHIGGPSVDEDRRPLAIWNEVTGRFAARIFFMEQGCLCWHRPTTSRGKARKVQLVDAVSCKVIQVEAVYDQNEISQFKYQLGLTIDGWMDKLVIGLVDEIELTSWLDRIREVVISVSKMRANGIPTSAATGDRAVKLTNRSVDVSEDPGTRHSYGADREDTESFGAEIALEGYLFKKSDSSRAPLIGVRPFNKRWFVLLDNELLYFKTRLQAESGERPSGSIQIRNVFNVREAEDPSAPENSIEIATPNRTFLVVAEDEEWQSRWLEALGDVLEARQEALAENAEAEKSNAAAKQEAMQRNVVHKGVLLRKSTNRITGMTSWKEAYFVLTVGALRQYEKEADYLDEDSDCVDEIGLVAIKLVETAPDTSSKNADGHLFDIRCNVKKGGDSLGQKTFSFDARTGDNANEWMRVICEASKFLSLVPKENGFPGFASMVSDDHAVEARRQNMMKRFQAFGVSGGPGVGIGGGRGDGHGPHGHTHGHGPGHHAATAPPSPSPPLGVDDLPPPPSTSVFARQVSLTGPGRGRGFRGGSNARNSAGRGANPRASYTMNDGDA